jgi:hypothetical protein
MMRPGSQAMQSMGGRRRAMEGVRENERATHLHALVPDVGSLVEHWLEPSYQPTRELLRLQKLIPVPCLLCSLSTVCHSPLSYSAKAHLKLAETFLSGSSLRTPQASRSPSTSSRCRCRCDARMRVTAIFRFRLRRIKLRLQYTHPA